MSARDDYPPQRVNGFDTTVTPEQYRAMCIEIDRLRADAEADRMAVADLLTALRQPAIVKGPSRTSPQLSPQE